MWGVKVREYIFIEKVNRMIHVIAMNIFELCFGITKDLSNIMVLLKLNVPIAV